MRFWLRFYPHTVSFGRDEVGTFLMRTGWFWRKKELVFFGDNGSEIDMSDATSSEIQLILSKPDAISLVQEYRRLVAAR
jgi:hypothetical protein